MIEDLDQSMSRTRQLRFRIVASCVRLIAPLIIVGTADFGRAEIISTQPTRGVFGLKIGLASRANIRGDLHLRTEIGSSAQVYADFPLFSDFFFTTAFDFYYVEIVRQNDIMIEGSLGLKKSFALSRANMKLIPGASLGYAYLPEIGVMNSTDYIVLKLFFESHFAIDPRKAWVAEVAVLGAPWGGNPTYDISYGPAFLVRVGLAFK